MTSVLCWDPERVRQYFSIEASAVFDQPGGQEVFERLHYPIDKIQVLRGDVSGLNSFSAPLSDGSEGTFIAEDGLLRAVRESPAEGNAVFGIRGAAGSGKSHLIRWLELQLDRDSRFLTIPVPRELASVAKVLNRMQQAVDLTANYVEQPMPSRERIVDAIHANLRLIVDRGAEWSILDQPLLRQLIDTAVRDYFAHTTTARPGISETRAPELNSALLTQFFQSRVPASRYAEAQGFIEKISSRFARTWTFLLVGRDVDITATMQDLQRRAAERGKRPVLLLEDITSFQALHSELFQFFMSLTASNWIAVMGWTPGYEQDQLRAQNLRERLRLHLNLSEQTDEGDRTFAFQDPDDLLGLAARYMNLIRACDREDCRVAGTCQAGDGSGLFPFTEHALRRFHANLYDAEDQRTRLTPRVFLTHVLRPLLNAATTEGRFPRMNTVNYLRALATPAELEPFRNDFPEWVELQKWFVTGATPEKYYDDLGLRRPAGATPPPRPTDEPESVPVPPSDPAEEQRRRAYQNHVQRLDRWLDGQQLPNNDELSRFVLRALKNVRGRNFLGASVYGLRFTSGETATAVVGIEGSGAQVEPHAVRIPQDETGHRVLRALVYREIYGNFETRWEAAFVFSQLEMWLRVAEEGLERELRTNRPAMGALLDVLAWEAAAKGNLESDDAVGLLAEVLPLSGSGSGRTRGSPLPGGQWLQTNLASHCTVLRAGMGAIARAGHDTLNLTFAQDSLNAYRRRGQTGVESLSPLRIATERVGPAIRQALDSINTFLNSRLQIDEMKFRELADEASRTRLLGSDLQEAVRTVRTHHQAIVQAARFSAVWQSYSQIPPFYLSPDAAAVQAEVAQKLAEHADAALHTSSSILRFSSMCRFRPGELSLVLDAAKKVQQALERVRSDILQARTSATGTQGAEIDSAINCVRETCAALKGGAA